MSPDWSASPEAVPYGHLDDPQSLNLYGYVRNNPLSQPDLDGHGCPPDCSTGNPVVDFIGGFANAWGSDNLAGALRTNQTTLSGRVGQFLGDATATGQGVGEFILGTGGNVAGVVLDATGVGAVVGVPANVISTAAMAHGGATALTGASNMMKDGSQSSSGAYSNTPENQERMSQGKAPVGNDGKPVELHHEGQEANGNLKEMTQTDHRGGENFSKNHPNTGQQPSNIDRGKFKQQRQQYWKDKANQ